MAIGYKLSDSTLQDQLKIYKNFGDVNFSFQEFIETMLSSTEWIKEFFINNNLNYVENLSQTITKNKKEEIIQFCMKNLELQFIKDLV